MPLPPALLKRLANRGIVNSTSKKPGSTNPPEKGKYSSKDKEEFKN